MKQSRVALAKNLQGRDVSREAKEKISKSEGGKMNTTEVKKKIVNFLAHKSDEERRKIYGRLDLSSNARKRLEESAGFSNKETPGEMKKRLKLKARRTRANISYTQLLRSRENELKENRKNPLNRISEDSSRLGVAGANYKVGIGSKTVSTQDKRGGNRYNIKDPQAFRVGVAGGFGANKNLGGGGGVKPGGGIRLAA